MSEDVIARAVSTDPNLEAAVIAALRKNPQVPFDRIAVTAHEGVVTLAGHVNWKYQCVAAASTAATVHGIGSVDNQIVVDIA